MTDVTVDLGTDWKTLKTISMFQMDKVHRQMPLQKSTSIRTITTAY